MRKVKQEFGNNTRDRIRILVLDDDYDVALTFKTGLEESGYDVDLFTDPNKVIREFEAGVYAMLLVDIRMPGITGFEVFEKLRKRDKHFRICFITAFQQYYDSIIEFFPRLDVNCFLKKPISIAELREHVEDELSKIKK
jgi:DNA-binding response OmpR family regulator